MNGRTGIGGARHFPRAKSPKNDREPTRGSHRGQRPVVVETEWMAAAETRMPTATKALAEREASMDGKVPPRRLTNAERRPREYLTPEEVERLITAAQKRIGARNPHRDATMILLTYRHGLRASELCSLRWDMLDLAQGRYHVTRRKNGRPSVHLLSPHSPDDGAI